MLQLLEFLTSFYWILLPQTLLESLWRVRWRRTYQRSGVPGVAWEGVRSILGTNTSVFFVPLGGTWSGWRIRRLLTRYEIAMWGWGFAHGEMYFHVRAEDAGLAEAVMLDAGVELLS